MRRGVHAHTHTRARTPTARWGRAQRFAANPSTKKCPATRRELRRGKKSRQPRDGPSACGARPVVCARVCVRACSAVPGGGVFFTIAFRASTPAAASPSPRVNCHLRRRSLNGVIILLFTRSFCVRRRRRFSRPFAFSAHLKVAARSNYLANIVI